MQLREDGFGSTYSNEQPVSDIGEGESLYAVEAAFSSDTGGMNGSTEEEASADVNRGLIGGDEFDTPMAQVMVAHVEVSPGSNRRWDPHFTSAGSYPFLWFFQLPRIFK